MSGNDDLRFKSHKHLLVIDAAVTELMKLVASGGMQGEEWELAKDRYSSAHSHWTSFLANHPDEDKTL